MSVSADLRRRWGQHWAKGQHSRWLQKDEIGPIMNAKCKTYGSYKKVRHRQNELRTKLNAAVEKAKEVCERLQEQTTADAKATDKAVREHPYQVIGIAFGLGILVGVLAMRGRGDGVQAGFGHSVNASRLRLRKVT